MHPDLDHIENLILEEIDGSISPADKIQLEQIITTNPAAARLKEDIYKTLAPEVLASLQNNSSVDNVFRTIRQRKQKKRLRFAAAATILLLVASTYYLLRPTAIPVNNQHIMLTMADGRNIDLTTHQGALQQDNSTLHNQQQTLTIPPGNTATTEWVSLTVPPGKDYHVQLPDGSEIWLNAASTMKFPLAFTDGKRRIEITGEAYLQVKTQPNQPFIVALPQGEIQVLGTSFNVNAYESNEVKVALINGSVKMHTQTDSLLLQPGQQLTYKTGAQIKTSSFDEEEVLSWRKGIYVFYGATLEEVSRIIPRWYGVRLVIDDNTAREKGFFGVIDRNKPIETFLEDLKSTNGITYYFDKDKVLHLR